MERQRSFPIKPTRFIVFSFTISSFIIFLTFASFWIFKNAPPSSESFFFFNKTPVAVTFFEPINLQTVNSFRKNFSNRDSIQGFLLDTRFNKSENISGLAKISITKEQMKNESIEDVVNGKLTTFRVSDGLTSLQGSKTTSIEKFEVPFRKKIKKKDGKVPLGSFQSPDKNHKMKRKRISRCDLTKGKWVLSENSSLYTNGSCPFIDEGFDCEGNGRLDLQYKKLRWQLRDCDVYRFNATNMLELIRGKRLVFVGDSINRNQWESLLCMLFSAINDPKRVFETHGRRITKSKGNYSFKFVDYKCTVEFYVSHFLVREGKARVGRKRVETLRIDLIDRSSSRWRGADILVFNSAHWWSHYKTKSGSNYYQEGDQVHPRLDVNTAFKRALTTWAAWVDKYINPQRTRVFFRNSAPSHFRGGLWNSGGHCREATQPVNQTLSFNYPEKNTIVEDIINEMKTPVTLLNITGLSDYRIDGHPSIYGKSLSNRQHSRAEDCSHWCLPGVPDIWNELLFFHLKYKDLVK